MLRGQERERSRIAQDLHDEVNQALTGILLRLEATTMDAPHALRPELQETKRLANQAMEELLHLARQLRPTALDDHGLIPALASQVEDFSQRTGIDARFSRHGEMPTLTDEEQLVIYRVTQESLSNIAQHAGARHVSVQLSFVGRTILRITDDGKGFDPGPGNAGRNGRPRGRVGGLGLSGMRERALLVGGNLAIYSAPARGHHDRTHHGSDMKILIADDHGIVRGGLRLLIDRQPDMEVVAEAEDGVDAFEQALQSRPTSASSTSRCRA